MVLAFVGTIIGMWFTLKADIELAKELPEPNISRTEYDLKDLSLVVIDRRGHDNLSFTNFDA